MAILHTVKLNINNTSKYIAVFDDDVTNFPEDIDILTTSASARSYAPMPGTVFNALERCGISADKLAQNPEIDLRNPGYIWLSKETDNTRIKRIGCVELLRNYFPGQDIYATEQAMITSIRAYFRMLDIAALYDIKMSTIALPLLGSGRQHISANLLLIPLINECIEFLKRNDKVENIYFIEKNHEKAELIVNNLKNSLRFSENNINIKDEEAPNKPMAFISYSSKDKNIADNLCSKLENRGIKVWYAPRDVVGAYAEAIANAIDASSYFIVILSSNSIASEHVLNEIDLAFQNLPSKIKFKPLRIDDAMFNPAFKYYLSRQHWMDASLPPLEERLNEFVEELFK